MLLKFFIYDIGSSCSYSNVFSICVDFYAAPGLWPAPITIRIGARIMGYSKIVEWEHTFVVYSLSTNRLAVVIRIVRVLRIQRILRKLRTWNRDTSFIKTSRRQLIVTIFAQSRGYENLTNLNEWTKQVLFKAADLFQQVSGIR